MSNTTALYILDNSADSDVVCGDYDTCLATAREWSDNPQIQESLVKDALGVIHLGNDPGFAITMTPVSEAVASFRSPKRSHSYPSRSETACIVDDGATATIYARPRAEVLAELRALPEGDTYSAWCSEHDYVLSTGGGDRHVSEIAEALGLPEIALSGGRWV